MFENKENSCCTYFSVWGDFDPDVVTAMLDLKPFNAWKKSDSSGDGKQYTCSGWEYGKCEEYDIETEKQMMRTISELIPKIGILNQIREQYGVEYFLRVVPEIYSYNSHPCLAPSLEVIDFCHETRTKIDIDLYVYE